MWNQDQTKVTYFFYMTLLYYIVITSLWDPNNIYVVVFSQLNIVEQYSQIVSFPQVGVKIKAHLHPPPTYWKKTQKPHTHTHTIRSNERLGPAPASWACLAFSVGREREGRKGCLGRNSVFCLKMSLSISSTSWAHSHQLEVGAHTFICRVKKKTSYPFIFGHF